MQSFTLPCIILKQVRNAVSCHCEYLYYLSTCQEIFAVVVQLLKHILLFATPWTIAHQAPISLTVIQSLLRFMCIEQVTLYNQPICSHPLILCPSVFHSIRVFFNESALYIRQTKYWSFGFSISPSNEYSGLISFRIGWFNIFAVQGTLKSLLYHRSSKASVLRCLAFFAVQLSRTYLTTGKPQL